MSFDLGVCIMDVYPLYNPKSMYEKVRSIIIELL